MNRTVYGMRLRTWLAGVTVLAVVGILAAASMPLAASKAVGPAMEPTSAAGAAGQSYAKTLSAAFRESADRVLPAVVLIRSMPVVAEHSTHSSPALPGMSEDNNSPFGELFRSNPDLRRFFRDMPSMPNQPRGRGFGAMSSGSGVIVDSSGIVLTNNHVVDGGGRIMVRLSDGREFKAVDVKRDPRTDLAIFRLDGKGPFPVARLGNSDQTAVGDWVLALGEPFGLEGTVTAGIISAKGRGLGITPRESFLQTDAAINPGNSGGPLVNLDGEVVGINTAISSESGGYQGVGFAIPVNLAKWVVDQLKTNGTVQRAYLGVVIQQVSQELADRFGVHANQGVLVSDVRANTPAAKAGLKSGDVILEFNGQAVKKPAELQGLVEQAATGSTQPLTILRDGRRMTIKVTCEAQPKNYGLAEEESSNSNNPASSNFEKLGIEVSNLTPEVAKKLGVADGQGVVITQVEQGGVAQLAGLDTGMVILEVNRKAVKSVEEFRAAVTKQSLAKGVLLLVRSDRGTRYVVLQTNG